MNTPVKRITAALKTHVASSDMDQTAALDDMASHNLAGFFTVLLEIDKRLEAQNRHPKDSRHENQ